MLTCQYSVSWCNHVTFPMSVAAGQLEMQMTIMLAILCDTSSHVLLKHLQFPCKTKAYWSDLKDM